MPNANKQLRFLTREQTDKKNQPKMAPGIAQSSTTPTASNPMPSTKETPSKLSPFPDGLKTSGQSPPIYSLLRPYEDYPKQVTGPTVWRAEDYSDNPERWTHRLSAEAIGELGEAADRFIASGMPLTGITKVSSRLLVNVNAMQLINLPACLPI